MVHLLFFILSTALCFCDPEIHMGRSVNGAANLIVLNWGEKASLTVGNYCSIAGHVTVFLGGEHDTSWISTYSFPSADSHGHPKTKGNVIIGSDVWIGMDASILSGVTIGDGAVVGAYAVVAKNVPPYAIVAGNPARIIRYRFDEPSIQKLLQIAWWNWSDSEVLAAESYLTSPDMGTFFNYCACKGKIPGPLLLERYEHHVHQPSDIHEHLPILKQLASKCSSVVEIGLREMTSSWGILKGLSESSSNTRCYLGIDIIVPPLKILGLAKKAAKENGIVFDFWQANDMDIDIPQTDMLFIDSLHTYCHLTYELEKFSPQVDKYIAMHDTSGPWGEADMSEYQGDHSEYPPDIDRTKRGLWTAVEDFLHRHPEWVLHKRLLNCNGLTILRRKSSSLD